MMDVRTVCPYCGVGCGLVLKVDGNRVTGLTPEAGHPVSEGTLCPKGATAHEFVHHPDRLTRPLLRRNGRLGPVTWEEALDHAAREILRVKREHGPRAVGLISSARGTIEQNYLAQKLARAAIGTNVVDNCFRICHSATVVGLSGVLGSGAMTNAIPEFADPGPKVLLLVGSNVPHSHPIIWNVWMRRALRAGTKLIVVDPRRTEAAKHATLHLQVRPGTEVALFNAMAHHIVATGLHDRVFLDTHCEGFESLEALLARYVPEGVADTCGVSPRLIREAAEMYAKGKPASIAYGLGVTEHRTGVDNVQTLANLALLTGNLGNPSGGVNALRGQNNVQGATDMCRPETLPGYQSWHDAEAVSKFERAYGVKLPVPTPEEGDWLYCSRMWERALQGELKALYCIGSDPALTEGNLDRVRRGLDNLELLVVQEVFPSETTDLADVVLPASSYAEVDGTYVNTDRRVQRVRRAIPPVGDSRPDWEILQDLSTRLGYPMRYAGPEEIFDEIRTLVPIYAGISYSRIEAPGGVHWPCRSGDDPGTPTLHAAGFPRGRARLTAVDWMPPAEVPDGEYPLLLTTGRTFLQYNAGTMTRRTRMQKGDPSNHVEVSAQDAARLGVTHGREVRVSTRRGSLVVPAKVVDIAPGVVWMPFHFGEAPTNLLTNNAVDPQCGITELKACAARLDPL